MTECTIQGLSVHCMTDACKYERQWEKYVELSHNSSYESSDSFHVQLHIFSTENRKIMLVSLDRKKLIAKKKEKVTKTWFQNQIKGFLISKVDCSNGRIQKQTKKGGGILCPK